jgi:hypothetical protein
MRIAFIFLVVITCICFQINSYGQLKLEDIKMEQIQQKKIRKYIACQIAENKHQFSDIRPSWDIGKDLSSYRNNEIIFFLNGNSEDIWKGYLSANPSKSWNGKNISFGLLLQKVPCNIFYNNDPIMKVDTGQIYFLNLKLLFGILNLPVAFEIIKIDSTEKVLEFSYIEGNKSSGVQKIKFLDIGSERTKIMHVSYYKSDSHFRDKWIYPPLHRMIVNDFHRNMRILLNLQKIKPVDF